MSFRQVGDSLPFPTNGPGVKLKLVTKFAKTHRECHDWIWEITNKIAPGMTFDATQWTLERYKQSWLVGKGLSIRPNPAYNYRR